MITTIATSHNTVEQLKAQVATIEASIQTLMSLVESGVMSQESVKDALESLAWQRAQYVAELATR